MEVVISFYIDFESIFKRIFDYLDVRCEVKELNMILRYKIFLFNFYLLRNKWVRVYISLGGKDIDFENMIYILYEVEGVVILNNFYFC